MIMMPELGVQNQFASELGLTLGWGNGSLSRLHSFQALVMSNGFCATQLTQPNQVIAASMCGTGAQNRGPCQDDEGGPMITFNVNTRSFTLIGILTNPACGSGMPDLYTRITALRQWISVNTGIDTVPPTSPPETTTPLPPQTEQPTSPP